jgi:hypothetical protein
VASQAICSVVVSHEAVKGGAVWYSYVHRPTPWSGPAVGPVIVGQVRPTVPRKASLKQVRSVTMRSKDEIQRVHDMLLPMLMGEVPRVWRPEDEKLFHVVADVLCWVLEHGHNKAFTETITNVERELVARGYKLVYSPQPFSDASLRG